jgi:murein DD-endopeptidase MepM/ murein hydrolase activator NlpD
MAVTLSARTLVAAATLVLLTGCAGAAPEGEAGPDARTTQPQAVGRATTQRHAVQRTVTPDTTQRDTTRPETTQPDTAQPDTAQPDTAQRGGGQRDGRRFWVKDRRRYRSPWYAGAHRRMINYGCTAAPYYAPDPRCSRGHGFHHGVDIAMECGTRLFSALRARVVDPDSAGALGSAYGRKAFRLRSRRFGVDIVIGHTRKVYVRPGRRVRPGQLIARASDMAAPDGCHLHFEVRPRAGSVEQAVSPRPRLRLRVDR